MMTNQEEARHREAEAEWKKLGMPTREYISEFMFAAGLAARPEPVLGEADFYVCLDGPEAQFLTHNPDKYPEVKWTPAYLSQFPKREAAGYIREDAENGIHFQPHCQWPAVGTRLYTKPQPDNSSAESAPTEEMIIAGMEASVLGRASVDDDSYVLSIWNAMIAAAPKGA